MPLLTYPYFQPPGAPAPLPMVKACVQNPRTGRNLFLYGILDTGADICTLPGNLLTPLGVDPTNLTSVNVTGVGSAPGSRCDSLRVGFSSGSPPQVYFPGANQPVPVLFVEGLLVPLLGREGLIDLCTATFDRRQGVVTVSF